MYTQMSTLDVAVEELKHLPGSKVEEVAALIHQLAQDVDEQKRQAFAATFASMSVDEAEATFPARNR